MEIGRRIQVIGNTCAGKSTLARRIGDALDLPVVELDGLNWQPGWVALTEVDPPRFERLLSDATVGDAWVVAGSYSRWAERLLWPRLETMVWLDPPLLRIVGRVLRRSWRRWRTRELLWGTNREQLWPQLRVWDRRSLVNWAVTQHGRKRREMLARMADARMAHVSFIRLRTGADVEAFVADLGTLGPGRAGGAASAPGRD
jgi:adenylate kinase family enzyme